MEIWIDAQLSPSLALWINQTFSDVQAHSVHALGLRHMEDEFIFQHAQLKNAIIMSKDADFIKLLDRFGPPPQIIWITAGNTSNARMREILLRFFPVIIEMLNNNEPFIEIQGD